MRDQRAASAAQQRAMAVLVEDLLEELRCLNRKIEKLERALKAPQGPPLSTSR